MYDRDIVRSPRGIGTIFVCGFAALALAGLTGCGSSDNGGSSDPGSGAAKPPSQKFEAAADYTKVGAYLAVNSNPLGWGACTNDYAVGNGNCPGKFASRDDTTYPFRNNTEGRVEWESHLRGNLPSALRGVLSPNERGIIITAVIPDPDHALIIRCLVSGRGSGDCFTGPDQMGKGAGTQGGPLAINATARSPVCAGDACNTFILIRGYCPKGNSNCTPSV